MEGNNNKRYLCHKSNSFTKKRIVSFQENDTNNDSNFLKCPACSRICLIDINEEQLSFSYKCNNELCHYKNNIIYQYFWKAKIPNERTKLNLSKSDIFCSIHPKFKFCYYCFDCQTNICQNCINDHTYHEKVDLNSIKPKDNEVFSYKLKLREKSEYLIKMNKSFEKWKKEFEERFNFIIKTITNIYNLEEFIVNNYDPKKNYLNYNYIKNFNWMKQMSLKLKILEIENFLQINNWGEKGHFLIDAITNIQNKKEMGEKMKINNKRNNLILNLKLKEKEECNIKLNDNNNNIEDLLYSNLNSNFKKDKIAIQFLSSGNKNNNKNSYYKELFSSYPKRVEKQILKGQNLYKSKDDILLTEEKNKNLEKKINGSMDQDIQKKLNKEIKINYENKIPEFNKTNNSENQDLITKNVDNNTDLKEMDEDIDIKSKLKFNMNIDNNIEEINMNKINNNIEKNSEQNIDLKISNNEDNNLNDARIENKSIVNKNTDENYSGKGNFFEDQIKNEIEEKRMEIKYEYRDNDKIKSIEIINKKRILICNSRALNIYKLNSEVIYKLDKIFSIRDFDNKINYATQISNGNIIICFTNCIYIIKLIEDNSIIQNYLIVQKLKTKSGNININKVIEIKHKNYLISCDNKNITIYSKINSKEYKEINNIKINEEVKCIEYINGKCFVSVFLKATKSFFMIMKI